METIPALFEEVLPIENTRGKNDRFEYAKARRGKSWYFVKLARSDRYIERIQRELVWSEFMNRIEAFYPEKHLLGPNVTRRIGISGVVFDFIDAPVVAEPGELEVWQRIIPRYADMLLTFDTVAQNWKSENLPKVPSRSEHVYEIWQEWLGDNIERYPRLQEARKRLETTHFKLTKCLQHGDLTPWQIFDTPQGWVVYDGEACGTDLFRFTDLAYGYMRLHNNLGSPSAAQELLRTFIAGHSMSEQQIMKEFLPVLVHVAVGGVADAYRDQPSQDYVEAAEQLLDHALDKNTTALLG